MRKARNRKGFTLAEVLIVVGILSVLAGVSFIGVTGYLRSMTKLEYDSYAREIFIAAQNHLSLAESLGYLGRTPDAAAGKSEGKIEGLDDTGGSGIYYFVVEDRNRGSQLSGDSILNLMLPQASVDETVRQGGSYIVRYHWDSGKVLDVFYWQESGGRYNHTYDADSDYASFLAKRENSQALKTYETDHSVIGYYGGAEALTLLTATLEAPVLRVFNSDTLLVTVKDSLFDPSDPLSKNYTLRLMLVGEISGKTRTISLEENPGDARISHDGRGTYTVVLDDIRDETLHFCKLQADDLTYFIPGENIRVQAVAEGRTSGENAVIAIPKYAVGTGEGDGAVANSLFGDGTEPGAGIAEIRNIRHLENLDRSISGVNLQTDHVVDGETVHVEFTKAVQAADLNWNGFLGGGESVVPASGTSVFSGCYIPVTPGYALDYDGRNHTVSGIRADGPGDAGMFGALGNGSAVSNLRLMDFEIQNAVNAGALAGTATGSAVSNVLAVSGGSDGAAASVAGSSSVGGRIGSAERTVVQKSAAALAVSSGGGDAGGLIGSATGDTAVSACYSGGRTAGGAYSKTAYNVTSGAGGAAGGLVGSFTGGRVEYSYSTCSVSGATAGGLVGAGTDGTFSGCYATGRVNVNGASQAGAFAGRLTGSTVLQCLYYEIINEISEDGAGKKGYTYLEAVPGGCEGISALDAGADTYNSFFGGDGSGDAWAEANARDAALRLYYQGKYPMKTVAQLQPEATGAEEKVRPDDFVAAHYGDWPAPEIQVINEK